MKLISLLEKLEYQVQKKNTDIEITQLIYDSRKVVPGCVFIALTGANFDGHSYVREVVEKGAAAVVVEKAVEDVDAAVIQVADTRYALALMSAAFFGNPAEDLFTIGITGTKGKTTTTYMIKNVLEACGVRTGLIGTIETVIGDERIPSKNTTPESYEIHKSFRKMADEGCKAVVMEVSSQGLMLKRTAGIMFDIGVFTNLEKDHIGPNEHSSMEQYIACKALLFSQCRTGIVNADDEHLDAVLNGHTCEVETYGICEKADVRAEDIRYFHEPGKIGTSYMLNGKITGKVELSMPGIFSVYNSLCAIAVTRHFGVDAQLLTKVLKQVKVKGRIELVPVSDQYTLIIDYAHNAMSLESILKTLREYHPNRLVCMFGCGGNRSRDRRFEMGEVSGKLADLTVITSDNPRFEEPQAIIDDIRQGVEGTNGRFVEIINRKEAIRYCMEHAQKGDIILLAGKGHEDYQEIKGVKYPMDERVLIAEVMKELCMQI
jgi:UDP-N-acetylmuramoyl-L-alanyl-D-glutamate--2,6-diaminopimelate ligase